MPVFGRFIIQEAKSATIDIWIEWAKEKQDNGLADAVQALRQQSKPKDKTRCS